MIYKFLGLGGNELEVKIQSEVDEDVPSCELKISVDPGVAEEFKIPMREREITIWLHETDVYNLIGALHSIKTKLQRNG